MIPSRSAAIVIPARLKSSRLPGKVLADIRGKPMLMRVVERCRQVRNAAEVAVATDSEEIRNAASDWGVTVHMTSTDCRSGTERIASIVDRIDAQVVVNVQGDEPLIEPVVVETIIETIFQTDVPIVTGVFKLRDLASILSPNIVKSVRTGNGDVLYFSRSPVPFVRDLPQEEWLTRTAFWGQVNVYAFRRKILEGYSSLPVSHLEDVEKVEQLRFLEAGIPWYSIESPYETYAVDTPADLERVRRIVAELEGAQKAE